MGFQEATTEIWSVDSQYSKDNGVMVLVTGSLQCKVSFSHIGAECSHEGSDTDLLILFGACAQSQLSSMRSAITAQA